MLKQILQILTVFEIQQSIVQGKLFEIVDLKIRLG